MLGMRLSAAQAAQKVYPNGRAVTLKDKPISENEAHQILLATVKKYEDAVNRYVELLPTLIKN